MSALLTFYAGMVAITFTFVSARAKPTGRVEWLALCLLSALWPAFVAYVAFCAARGDR